MQKSVRSLTVVALFSLAVACTTTSVTLPPVTEAPTGAHLPGKIIWHDLLANDVPAVKRFYGELFGWEFQDVSVGQGMSYTLIRNGGRPIAGLIDAGQLRRQGNISQWVVVMSVEDVDAAVAAVEKGGGSVFTRPTDLTDRGRIAVVADSRGALFAMLRSQSGDPVDREPAIGDFLWDEVWTDDIVAATEFYPRLAPYSVEQRGLDDGSSFTFMKAGGQPRVGILPRPVEDLKPTWVSYIRVADPQAITDRVESLGGRVLAAPRESRIEGQVAVITDPSGAGVVLQTWTAK